MTRRRRRRSQTGAAARAGLSQRTLLLLGADAAEVGYPTASRPDDIRHDLSGVVAG